MEKTVYNILVVDDDRTVASSLKDSLEFHDFYKTDIALTSNEAVSLVKKKKYDAYLVDQKMPDKPGTEFIRDLLKYDRNPLVYVITAEDDGTALAAAERAVDDGGLPIHSYIRKPWPPSLFTVELIDDLRERALRRELTQSLDSFSRKNREVSLELETSRKRIHELDLKEALMSGALIVVRAAKHEVNNINAGIYGNITLLNFLIEDIGERIPQEHIEKLKGINDKLANLSKRLSSYTEFIDLLVRENDEELSMVSFRDVLLSVLEQMRDSYPAGKFIVDMQVCECNLTCFSAALKNGLYHIIKNAFESMNDGGLLTIKANTAGEKLVVKFIDTGRGMLPDEAAKIFVPFFTNTKTYGGKGGSIVYKIIREIHNGEISVESEKGRGTKVTVTIPVAQEIITEK
ncbi:MAG: ATP-binding protein [Fibrobacterota bacterium]